MHTSAFEVPGLGTVTVAHNGDWSGEVCITVPKQSKGSLPIDWRMTTGETHVALWLPSEVLLGVGRQAAYRHLRDRVSSFLDNLGGPSDMAAMPPQQPLPPELFPETPGRDEAPPGHPLLRKRN